MNTFPNTTIYIIVDLREELDVSEVMLQNCIKPSHTAVDAPCYILVVYYGFGIKVRSRIKVTMECEQLRGLVHTGTVRNL